MDRLVIFDDGQGTVLRNDAPGHRAEAIRGWDRSAPLSVERQPRLSHGSLSGPAIREGRRYVLRWLSDELSADGVLLARQDALGTFSGLGEGSLTVVDSGVARTAPVYLDGEILVDDLHVPFGWLRFEIPLWSDEAYRYGPPAVTTLRPTQYGPGLQYPLLEPGYLDFGVADVPPVQPIRNAGDATAWPTVTVYANCPSGFLLRSGSQVVEWRGACDMAAPVVVDMAGQVLVGEADASALLTRRDWVGIPRGGSVTIEFELLGPGTGWAEVTSRDTWI